MKWQKTKTAHLLKNTDSGVYYSRLYHEGKEVWKSLKTQVYSVAQARLAEEQKTLRHAVKVTETVESGKATAESVAKIYLDGVRLDPSLKPSMVYYREQCVSAILKTWPELATLTPKSITETQCLEWAARFADRYSGTRYNNGVDTLRKIFGVAIKHGLAFKNPAESLPKRQPSRKHLELPSKDQFTKLVTAIRSSGAWCQEQCGDLVEFLAYSGCRIDEARHIKWSDVQGDSIWVHGDPKTGTKNQERRRIPIIPPMRRLLDDMTSRPRLYREKSREGYVLAVTECREALETACEKVGIKKIGHHDLRHLFATRAIESGVDIPTVSRFLGHKDGGVLAMRIYGHLCDSHAQAMAAKIIF